MVAQLGQLDDEHISTLLANVTQSIDEIVEKVRKLIYNSHFKSVSKTISFINQVLYEDMDIKAAEHNNFSLEDFSIDQVCEIYT